jgi:hypothetical protein
VYTVTSAMRQGEMYENCGYVYIAKALVRLPCIVRDWSTEVASVVRKCSSAERGFGVSLAQLSLHTARKGKAPGSLMRLSYCTRAAVDRKQETSPSVGEALSCVGAYRCV